MSNLSDLKDAIDKISNGNDEGIALIGSSIGTIADLAGGVGAVISVVQLASALLGSGGDDQTQAMLNDILATIKAEYQKLHKEVQGLIDKFESASVNNTLVVTAVAIGQNLASDVAANLSSDGKSSRLEACLAAVNSLALTASAGGLNQVWQVVQEDQLYFVPTNPWVYDDGGLPSADFPFTYENLAFQRTFIPDAGPDGLVFNYTYVLPAYLRTIMIYLAVGVAFYPNFGHDHPDHTAQLRHIAEDLLGAHDLIKGGIVSIAAPSKDDVIPYGWFQDDTGGWTADIALGPVYRSSWEVATIESGGDYNREYVPPTDYIRPYGAINLFSGYSSVGSYSDPGLPDGAPNHFPPDHIGPDAWPPSDWYLGFYGKYLLYTLKRNKDVYRETALSQVRQIINHLRVLAGDPVLTGPVFADWSLREVFDVLGYPNNHLLTGKSVRSLAQFLQSSPPASEALPISLRQMLGGTL